MVTRETEREQMTYLLGCHRSTPDARTLYLADYLTPAVLPTPPAAADYTAISEPWNLLGNQTCGDCTVAGLGHAVMLWAKQALGLDLTITDDQAIKLYSAITGYKPSDPNSDRGASLLQVLKYAARHGAFGHKIGPYLQVDPSDLNRVKSAINLFGCVYTAVELPDNVLPQSSIPPWTKTTGTPNPNNGHAIIMGGYDALKLPTVTWGTVIPTSWAFWRKYVVECWVILSPDWSQHAPCGFNAAQLQADLSAFGAQTAPHVHSCAVGQAIKRLFGRK
jgi:hypothetical protein